MEVNPVPNQNNNTAAAAGAGGQQVQKQENNPKQVTPAKESANTMNEGKQAFDQDRLIEDAVAKNVITDDTQLFNFRVTRYSDNLTFTDVNSGDVTTVPMKDVVGDNAIDAAI